MEILKRLPASAFSSCVLNANSFLALLRQASSASAFSSCVLNANFFFALLRLGSSTSGARPSVTGEARLAQLLSFSFAFSPGCPEPLRPLPAQALSALSWVFWHWQMLRARQVHPPQHLVILSLLPAYVVLHIGVAADKQESSSLPWCESNFKKKHKTSARHHRACMHTDACAHLTCMHAHAFLHRRMRSLLCARARALIVQKRAIATIQNFKAISKRNRFDFKRLDCSPPLGKRKFREPEQRSSSSFAQVFKFTPSLGRELELSVTDRQTHARTELKTPKADGPVVLRG